MADNKPYPFDVCKKCCVAGEASNGEDGLSAYEIAVKNGFEGTEQEWLDSLKASVEIVNNLVSTDPDKALSANMGYTLEKSKLGVTSGYYAQIDRLFEANNTVVYKIPFGNLDYGLVISSCNHNSNGSSFGLCQVMFTNYMDRAFSVRYGTHVNGVTRWNPWYKVATTNDVDGKADKPNVVEVTGIEELEPNTIYKTDTLAVLSTEKINDVDKWAEVIFTYTEGAEILVPETVKLIGIDVDESGNFYPVTGKTYSVLFTYNGVDVVAMFAGV